MILIGDCLERLKELEPNSIDAVVTDPPYGWRFMGKAWDSFDIATKGVDTRAQKHEGEWRIGSDGKRRRYGKLNVPNTAAGSNDLSQIGMSKFQEFSEAWAREALRVLKPGGHMLVFCGPRTYHRMASGVEDAGFQIRDQLQWLFGSGFPKSHNIGDGIGTALKPANEPIVLARKPLEKGLTVGQNVEKWGVGGLNIDESRIGVGEDDPNHRKPSVDWQSANDPSVTHFGSGGRPIENLKPKGRWPANLLLDETAAEMLDEQSGTLKSGGNTSFKGDNALFPIDNDNRTHYKESGGASRFFYVAKTSKRERNAGLDGMPDKKMAFADGANRAINSGSDEYNTETGGGMNRIKTVKNHHPTVKPLKLMEYLIKLITPAGGIVLDPFMGSGSTGVAAFRLGYKFIGCEMNAEYVEIAKKRMEAV